MGIVAGVVVALTEAGMTGVCADRRWLDPEPGGSVIVVTAPSTWTPSPTTADYPEIKINIYSAATDSPDAERIGEAIAVAVRRVLHVTDGHLRHWGDQRVLRSGLVGWSLLPVEGHPDWALRVLTFEVQTA